MIKAKILPSLTDNLLRGSISTVNTGIIFENSKSVVNNF
jgi:hypothetical protein